MTKILTMNDPWEIWGKEAAQDVREAGYRFYSTGRWYKRGTEAILLFNISGGNNGADPNLQTVEDYIESGDTNYSGLFGGWCENNPQHEDGWDEEGCGYDEFDIYKDGKLVKRGEEWNI
jgi:hypothetical protein